MATKQLVDRLMFLITQEGSRSAVESKYKASVRTQGRILTDPDHQVSKRIARIINRAFRENAPEATKIREAKGKRAGWALVDRKKALTLQKSFRRAGVKISVVAQQKYTEAYGGSKTKTKVEFGKGKSVQDAEQALEGNFERLYEEYDYLTFIRIGEIMFRVYPRG